MALWVSYEALVPFFNFGLFTLVQHFWLRVHKKYCCLASKKIPTAPLALV